MDGVNRPIMTPMVSFCDIPITRAAAHITRYGCYGIGLTKEWGKRNLVQPIAYLSQQSQFMSSIYYLLDMTLAYPEEEGFRGVHDELLERAFGLLSMVKTIKGMDFDTGEGRDFLNENEWRFVPPRFRPLYEEDYYRQRDLLDTLIKDFKLEMKPADIKYLFVKDEDDIENLFEFIQSEFQDHPRKDVSLLCTRILVTENIRIHY